MAILIIEDDAAMREVRVALLEADVNYKVAKDFIERTKQRALGQDVLTSVTPGQQIIKIVHDELTRLIVQQFRQHRPHFGFKELIVKILIIKYRKYIRFSGSLTVSWRHALSGQVFHGVVGPQGEVVHKVTYISFIVRVDHED